MSKKKSKIKINQTADMETINSEIPQAFIEAIKEFSNVYKPTEIMYALKGQRYNSASRALNQILEKFPGMNLGHAKKVFENNLSEKQNTK